MTHYNRKTYQVDDIDFDSNPLSTFDLRDGARKSFADYHQEKYDLRVTDVKQPLLLSRPKKKDFHRGATGPVKLIPEFCQMTGLTDEMRGNFQLMRSLAEHLQINPTRRIEKVKAFMARLQGAKGVREELDRWGVRFNNDLVKLPGRVMEVEKIVFGQEKEEKVSPKADWDMAFRSREEI